MFNFTNLTNSKEEGTTIASVEPTGSLEPIKPFDVQKNLGGVPLVSGWKF